MDEHYLPRIERLSVMLPHSKVQNTSCGVKNFFYCGLLIPSRKNCSSLGFTLAFNYAANKSLAASCDKFPAAKKYYTNKLRISTRISTGKMFRSVASIYLLTEYAGLAPGPSAIVYIAFACVLLVSMLSTVCF